MNIANIKATTLRTVLMVVLSATIAVSAIGFYIFQDWIRNYSIEINEVALQPVTDSNDPQALAQIRDEISSNQIYGDKASSMIAANQNYKDQIIKDIDKYASISGVSITDYNLANPNTLEADTTFSIDGIKPEFVTITLKNPITLQNLLNFFKLIESNLPVMQITGINLTPSDASSNSITTDPITIEVYTR